MADIELTCVEFAEKLASKTPTPGGGGAAALAGALGAALCSMVGNYTIGKKKYADVEEDIIRLTGRADALRTELLELVERDAEAFEPLSKAYAYPKDAPDRAEVLEAATLAASRAPMEMVRKCAEVLDLLEEMEEKGSVMLLSDVGCGAILAGAAMRSAAMNVFINTKSLQNRAEAEELERETDELLRVYSEKAEKTAAKVAGRIRS